MSADIILKQAIDWSGYLKRYINSHPDIEQQLIEDSSKTINRSSINSWFDELNTNNNDIRFILRKLRQRLFTSLMVRDINNLASLHEIVAAMSYFAELAIGQAYKTAMYELINKHGQAKYHGQAQDMLILGMGKLGGTELNVSSDIDLIMLYGTDGQTDGAKPISNSEFYAKVCRKMTDILSQPDANGIVFRTDLRLRPDGANGLLAWSLEALKNYLIRQGREWERYAWLKARIIQCPIFDKQLFTQQAHTLQSLRQPFVYRKYLDFDSLSALRQLRQRIRQDWQKRANSRKGIDTSHNIKLGEGGIREIEFVIQLNQLIRGGRRPSLQQRNLIAAIHKQRRAGILNETQASGLHEAYLFLRRLEHFLQYKEDEQTHLLPRDDKTLALLATTLGFDNTEEFEQKLNQHRQFVSKCFNDAFRIAGLKEDQTTINSNTVKSNEITDDQHQTIQLHIDKLLTSHRIRSLSSHSLNRLKDLLPKIKETAITSKDPVSTTIKLLNLIEHIAQRSSYLALLDEYPQTLCRMAKIISASNWASQYLLQYPLLLDSLIEWRSLMQEPNFAQISEQLANDLDACLLPDGQADIEQQMNLMRDLQHRITFQLLAQDLEDKISVESLADYLSALADLLLEETINRVWPQVKQHKSNDKLATDDLNKPKFAIIAYGKLGGKELGYASDLDLVFLYDDPDQNASDIYARLGRRVASWLSTMTSSGRLYEIDLRLRPDGDAGLLAIPIDSFENYQLNNAWAWEHQAITRARFVAGDKEIGQRFEGIRKKILLLPRDTATLRSEVTNMRARIFKGHPNKSDLFDIKHDQGGMVDIEFITQFLVLNYAHIHQELINNLGNINLLGIAAKAKLIPDDLASQVANAYRNYRREQHSIRMQGADKARVDKSLFGGERQAVKQLWDYIFVKLL